MALVLGTSKLFHPLSCSFSSLGYFPTIKSRFPFPFLLKCDFLLLKNCHKIHMKKLFWGSELWARNIRKNIYKKLRSVNDFACFADDIFNLYECMKS